MLRQSRLSFLDSSDNHHAKLIEKVEKNFGEMCSSFGSFTRKTAGIRDKCDELAKTIHTYSEVEENINKDLSSELSNFSKTMTLIGDCKDIEVQRLELKITGEISHYENICKNTKEELKACLLLKEKELMRKRQLDQIRLRNPRDRKKQATTETEIRKANVEITKTSKEMDVLIDSFEEKKSKDIKSILLDFILIEIKMHAKSLEILTAAYQDISNGNVNTRDTEQATLELKTRSQSMSALNSIFQSPRRPSLIGDSPPESPLLSNQKKITKAESLDKLDDVVSKSSNSTESEQDEESESEKIDTPAHVRRPFQF